ncbi:MAG: antibiotic biosynthesis monooxygenase family protein [Candidatus Limnocylindrales bacterium]
MKTVWAMGTWIVRLGQGDAFAAAWRAFAEWGLAAHGPARAWLLRDRDNPDRIISVGPWPDEEAMRAWRSDPEFGPRIERVRQLVTELNVATLDQAVAVDG